MIIIALEGLDKSGKASQSKLLAEALTRNGLEVVQTEFHRYETPTGQLIAKFLANEWDVDQPTIELIMAADKQAQQKWFTNLEALGVQVLIMDRYTGSQWVYSQAQDNGVSIEFAKSLQTYMRQPDHTIVIDISPELSMSRKGKHNNGVNDRYESDRELLSRVRMGFLSSLTKSDMVVEGTSSVEEIHEQILKFVQFKLAVHAINKGEL
jgi:dTMP kinase